MESQKAEAVELADQMAAEIEQGTGGNRGQDPPARGICGVSSLLGRLMPWVASLPALARARARRGANLAQIIFERWLAISGREAETGDTAAAYGNLRLIYKTRSEFDQQRSTSADGFPEVSA